jgi:hypothetical protein
MKAGYKYTSIYLPRETSKRLRIMAAEMETSISSAGNKLIELGLKAYEKENEKAGRE